MKTRILVLLAVMILAAGCGSTQPKMPPLFGDCQRDGAGNTDNRNPMVCVNAWIERDGANRPTGSGWVQVNPFVIRASHQGAVVVRWETRVPGQAVTVSMKDGENNRCTTQPRCNGNGGCQLVIRPDAAPHTRCEYSVGVTFANGYSITLDPIVEIDDN